MQRYRLLTLLLGTGALLVVAGCDSGNYVKKKPPVPNAPAGNSPGGGKGASREPAIGQTAMEIEGTDADGKAFKLSDYRGKVVVLDFWGGW